MPSYAIRKKAGQKDLRKAFLRDERAVEKELSFQSTGIRSGQSQAEAVAQATSEEAFHQECGVEEKVGHDAECPGCPACRSRSPH